MPNKAIQNAKRLRSGALGQSSRFYNIYGQQVGSGNPDGFKGGQGWTTHNPSIGSMLSLGIAKQNKNAGGNNVCEPGPGPKNKCVSKEGNNNLTVGNLLNTFFGWDSVAFGDFVPRTINAFTANDVFWTADLNQAPATAASFQVRATTNGLAQTAFSSISFINCDDNTVRTYFTNDANFVASPTSSWAWEVAASGFTVAEEFTYWTQSVGKTLKVVIDDNSLLLTGNGTGDYCCKNSDCNCNCRGPSGACPCRSKVDANGIRKHC